MCCSHVLPLVGECRKIRGYDVAIETSVQRWVCVGHGDIEARVAAQIVAELSQSFVAQSEVQSQRPANPIVILRKSDGFPGSIFTISKTVNIGRGKDIAESPGPISACVEAE